MDYQAIAVPRIDTLHSLAAVRPCKGLLSVLLALTLTACGGGGSSSPQPELPANDEGQGGNGDVPVNDGGNTPLQSYTISGLLSANNAIQVDSDVNDPFTTATANNTLSTAQQLSNPAVVKGYVTAVATGLTSDRFEDSDDTFDVFRITAFARQSILLEIADFNTASPASVDLDIGLFDQSGELLETSLNVSSAFEALVIPTDGEYFVAINAFAGSSNYTLTIATEFATAAFDSQISLSNLRMDKLTLIEEPAHEENTAFVASMGQRYESLTSQSPISQAISLDLNTDAMARMSARQKGTSANAVLPQSLFSLNTDSSAKLKSQKAADALSLLALVKTMNSREGKDVFRTDSYPSTFQSITDPVPDRFLQWNLPAIGWDDAQAALQNITLQKRPILAVIDSGLFVNHPDLAGVIIDQRDFVPPFVDGDGFVADASQDVSVNDDSRTCHGFHGTHVATTAVAPQNEVGITGVAPGIGLIGIKIGHSLAPNCGLFGDLENAILYAAGLSNSSGTLPPARADVINMSLGGRGESPEVTAAISRAVAQGVIVVAAAGNDGAPIRSFPAASNNVIAVGATDVLNDRAPYSSFYPEVDIAAPGGDMSVDINGDGRADGIVAGIATIDGNRFVANWQRKQGTSMASPMVAAGIALMKGIQPSLTQQDIESLLASGELTIDIDAAGFDNNTGFGIMSLPKMIESATQFGGGDAPTRPTVITSTPASLDYGATLDEISIELIQSGDSSVSVESITGSGELQLSDGSFPVRVVRPDSANGFGIYSFVLDRSTFDEQTVTGEITFNLSNDTSNSIPVSAVNQSSLGVASSAAVFFIIERLNSDNEFVPLETQFAEVQGVQSDALSTPEIEEGSYRIIFGTDTDNDGVICDAGELCGTFPPNSFGFNSALVLNENIIDANYILQDIANIDVSAFDGTEYPAIEPRRIVKQGSTISQ